MDANELLVEIRSAFPLVEMPSRSQLASHADSCHGCEELVEDLEQYRGKPVDEAVLRLVHQELVHLSAAAWRWLMPHYLSYCLTPRGEFTQMETQFLVLHLGPKAEYVQDTIGRLSLLNASQIGCLIHFMERLASHPDWSEYFPENINAALELLREIDA